MFKKLVSLFVLFIALVSLPACSSPSTPSAPFSWNGTWSSEPDSMSAEISNDTIQIDIVTDDLSGLYWKGTWPSTTEAADGAVLTSEGDVDAMFGSLLGSQDTSKEFIYDNGEITFSFSMLGVTKTVRLQK